MKNYVKEYRGYKVPEGATHFNDKRPLTHAFYKKVDGIWHFKLANVVDDVFTMVPRLPETVIELPEALQEWLPEAGMRCNHMYDNGRTMEALEEVFIVGVDKNGLHVYQKDNSDHYYSDNQAEFLPLKTQQEKDREAFIDAAIKSIDTAVFSVEELGLVSKAIIQLSVADFKAPKVSNNE